MSVDPSAPEELYVQLADVLTGQIASGELPPRTKLQPQLDMAQRYGVSRGTVARATDVLTEAGLLRFVRGKGLYTANPDVIEAWRKQKQK
jgi:DNA-binding GntR family transcriptional regulator